MKNIVSRIDDKRHLHPAALDKLDRVNEPLYVITCLFNPAGWYSRYKHYIDFEHQMLQAGVHLIVVEAAFGEREHVIKESVHDRHTVVHVRVNSEIWLKESLMQKGFEYVPHDAKYVAFIDADMHFTKPRWVEDTLRQLQHSPCVQMFSEVAYLGPDGEMMNVAIGFAERWNRGHSIKLNTQSGNDKTTKVIDNDVFFHKRLADSKTNNYGEWGQPGGAWAYRVKELNEVGGLIDFMILGSGDWFMAASLVGFAEEAIPNTFSPELREMILAWQTKAVKVFRKNIGVVSGVMFHHWHGKMVNRRYGLRDAILKKHQFSPKRDLIRNRYGVWELHDHGDDRSRLMRDQIRQYQMGRNEDGVDK